ncbi:phosphate transport system permease protein [Thermosyntropha lipolytica DSM 11003]|uniref:Phosphate transport system permease protein PstA n=1 Tax=Thermosyntropha lipolytica DSM 11003 TaxID=1123382 RepID=A0A1M5K6G3_9FIRM|nr:phosphate ABC transporter permease PstA [Thermosyntropha lipolytica]SHG48398.1 phosphate transport system permease protein [Thermosyntropha lipolytica DSM 11003]
MPTANYGEKVMTLVFWLAAFLITAILAVIIGYIVVKGFSVLSLDFIFTPPSRAGKEGGISTTIVSTLYLVLGSLLIAVPVGVASAVYLEEYARKNSRFAYIVNLTAETLAGIPSIVFGLFGFVFFVIFLGWGWSILSGAMTMAIMILPTITRTSQEAILAVPREYRENSLALGASKWQTIRKIVLPSALPGIATGIILSIGRAVGETAALLLTAGSSLGMPMSITDPARTMAVHLYILAMEGISLERAFGTAFVIIVLILIINYAAHYGMRRLSALGR